MKNLADLTLELSTELSRLDKRCRRELASSERERDRALIAGGAERILARYHKDLDETKRAQLGSLDKADEVQGREVLKAEDKRRGELLKEERKFRATRAKASRTKRDQTRKAKQIWRDAVSKARRTPLTGQRALRKAADEALERALEDARRTFNLAVEDGRLTYRSALQDDLVDERLAVEKAHRKAERSTTSAAIAYERAVAQAEARMGRELRRDPEAERAGQEHDRRIADIRRACERDKEAAFRELTRQRRQLTERRLKKRTKK